MTERDAPAAGGVNVVRQCREGLMVFNRNDIYIGRSLDLYGEYSESEAEVFRKIVRPGMTALDIGANIGVFTVMLAKAVGPEGAVIAFEPQRSAFQALCANVALNSFNNVDCRYNAVGRRRDTVAVPVLDPGTTQNFGGLELGDRQKGLTVKVITVDSLNLTQCHFMKVDVEGMERDVIQGARRTIRKCRPLMYVENDRAQKSEDLIRAIDALGYKMFWHRAPLFNPGNFNGNGENVFGRIISLNMLCLPSELNPQTNLPIVEVPKATGRRRGNPKGRESGKPKGGGRGKQKGRRRGRRAR